MDEIPILNLLPEKYRGIAMFAVLAFPYLTRAYAALASGGGLVGIVRAILFGTNVDKELKQQVRQLRDTLTHTEHFRRGAVDNGNCEEGALPHAAAQGHGCDSTNRGRQIRNPGDQ